MSLKNLQCQNAKPSEKPYRLFDGHGLYLEVMPNGGKYWRFKYSHLKKEKRLSFGVYPEVSLLEAREKRTAARKQVAAGFDRNAYYGFLYQMKAISNSFEKWRYSYESAV